MDELRAFVDESSSDRTRDPGTYILAATLTPALALPEIRDDLGALRLKGQKKVHWRDEQRRRRVDLAERIAHLPVRHVVVVRTGAGGERLERRRRACLRRLLMELDAISVAHVVAESRGRADDERDRVVTDAYRREGSISADLRLFHQPGPHEPLLWSAARWQPTASGTTRHGPCSSLGVSFIDATDAQDPRPCRPAGAPGVHF